jgi:hypothetical protein
VGFGIDRLDVGNLAALAFAGLGPLVAVWRFDLGEKGMIGDAGANSMGAFLGFLFATSLPTWALMVAVVVLAAVNLLSERVSFSKIIEGNAVLSVLDKWGRKKDMQADSVPSGSTEEANRNNETEETDIREVGE